MTQTGKENGNSQATDEPRSSGRAGSRLARGLSDHPWVRNLSGDLTGPFAYRTWIVILTSLVAAYFGIYAVIESRHDRQMNRAMFERNTFITMVSSGNRGTFVAAMKNFGPIQTMSVSQSPPIFSPWKWFGTELPNLKPLWQWAMHRATLCTSKECGNENYRIDLHRSDFTNAELNSVDLNGALLSSARLNGAKLSWANLTGALLDHANLAGADLTQADLTGAHIVYADLSGADLTKATLRNVDLTNATLPRAKLRKAVLPNAKLIGAHFIEADLTEAHLVNADLTGAFLSGADLTGAYLAGANLTDVDVTRATLKTIFSAYWNEETVWPKGVVPPCRSNFNGERCTE